MSFIKTFEEICDFCASYPQIHGGLPDNDDRALKVVGQLRVLTELVKAQIALPNGWRTEVSEGNDGFPRVPWLALLPPKQEVSKGVYVVLCFGKNGDGAVGGCIQSATHKIGMTTVIRKKQGLVPTIDVDGVKPWAKYNNCFANPIEFIRGSVDETVLLKHIESSIKLCSVFLGGSPLQKMVAAFRQVFPDFKTFAECGPDFQKNEDGYKRSALGLFSDFFNAWLEGTPESLAGSDFSSRFLRLFAKAALVDKFTMMRLNDKILKSSELLPKFQLLCHSLLVRARKGDALDAELDNLISFIIDQGMEQPASSKLIPTCLLMFANPAKFIFIKPTQVDAFFKALGYDALLGQPLLNAEYYRKVLERFTDIRKQLGELGPRDMIDLQSFYYVAVKYGSRGVDSQPESEDPADGFVDLPKMFSDIVFAFATAIAESGFSFNGELPLRITASLSAKPFLLLTGLSGSGKTKLAQIFSKWICAQDKQFELIAVGADWTSNENLLGYPDALKAMGYRKPDNGALDLILRAKNDPDNPYFLILDEMNLSHVERYFADFLSAMESGEAINLHDDTGEDWSGVPAKLKMPDNLFVIGTVNVDETTYMFSPKVLDRANVIEFRVSNTEMGTFLSNPSKPDLAAITGAGKQYARAFVAAAGDKKVPLDEDTRKQVADVLMAFFPQLQEAGAEFGYRTAHEICRFVYFHKELSGNDWAFSGAMDAAIMQKLLPKLHGSKKKLGPVLTRLIRLCMKEEFRPKDEKEAVKEEFIKEGSAIYWNSLEKLGRMQRRLQENGFTSFAEA